jgi:hypothetical protein
MINIQTPVGLTPVYGKIKTPDGLKTYNEYIMIPPLFNLTLPPNQIILADSVVTMVHHWKFDDLTANPIDAIDGGQPLVPSGTTTIVTGKLGYARVLNPNNRMLCTDDNMNTNIPQSWVGWFKLMGGVSGYVRLFNAAYQLYSDGIVHWDWNHWNTGIAPTIGDWHFAAAVRDGPSGQIRIWIDNNKFVPIDYPGLTIGQINGSPWELGDPIYFSTVTVFDDVAIFQESLTDDQIDALYNGGNGLNY